MAKKAIVLLAEGFEEVEAVTPIDYLRRAGVEVTVAAVGHAACCESGQAAVKGARGISVIADTTLKKLAPAAGDWDAVIIPGGLKGAENLAACEKTGAFLKEMAAAGKLVCAICASPAVVLAPLGLLEGKEFTCYPGFEGKVTSGKWSDNCVVADGNVITSRAAGTAGDFAIAIIEILVNGTAAKKTADSVLLTN